MTQLYVRFMTVTRISFILSTAEAALGVIHAISVLWNVGRAFLNPHAGVSGHFQCPLGSKLASQPFSSPWLHILLFASDSESLVPCLKLPLTDL
jgi:hypothetical protein